MATRISAEEFENAAGVEDWRVEGDEVAAVFRTGSFVKGVAFIDALAPLAEALDHHPDVDLRYPAVSIRLTTHDVDGLSDLDITLAQQISALAGEQGIGAD